MGYDDAWSPSGAGRKRGSLVLFCSIPVCGSSSVVESQPSKLWVAGSSPVFRSQDVCASFGPLTRPDGCTAMEVANPRLLTVSIGLGSYPDVFECEPAGEVQRVERRVASSEVVGSSPIARTI